MARLYEFKDPYFDYIAVNMLVIIIHQLSLINSPGNSARSLVMTTAMAIDQEDMSKVIYLS